MNSIILSPGLISFFKKEIVRGQLGSRYPGIMKVADYLA